MGEGSKADKGQRGREKFKEEGVREGCSEDWEMAGNPEKRFRLQGGKVRAVEKNTPRVKKKSHANEVKEMSGLEHLAERRGKRS